MAAGTAILFCLNDAAAAESAFVGDVQWPGVVMEVSALPPPPLAPTPPLVDNFLAAGAIALFGRTADLFPRSLHDVRMGGGGNIEVIGK